jgi:hypothetical protein
MKYRVMLATVVLFLSTLLIAHANMNINVVNGTGKAFQFAVSEPDGTTSTDLYTVNSNATYNFNLDEVLAKDCDKHGLCHKAKFWVVLEKWGDGVVYLRCPKMFNPKGETTYINLDVSGDDSSTLSCSMSSAKPHKASLK